ncbi:MAG: GNAT family N-acetyltransferase [Candidatus Riflebacteria bacterium]|nr:GNAT family N-acetyltransferase [Candidatus Riflebacteria bacterium]
MSEMRLIMPAPQDWAKLEQVEEIEQAAFGVDGLSVFNISLFARGDSLYCVSIDGRIVAEAIVLYALPSEKLDAVLFSLAVHPDFSRRGCATFLLNKVVEILKDKGFASLSLTMNPENVALKELYIRKFGFEKKADLGSHPVKKETRHLVVKQL